MALSVRLEPAIEARIEEEAHRLGISKSEFVKDAIERMKTMGIVPEDTVLAPMNSMADATSSDGTPWPESDKVEDMQQLARQLWRKRAREMNLDLDKM